MHEGLRIYNLLPWRAGRVVQWQAHLPRIAAMNFNAVYVNGFHAPGAAGSVLDHYALNPLLRGTVLRGPILRGAEATDDAALLAGFAASCAEHKLMAMMDLAIDHVARTSPLVVRHPGWFARDNAKHGPELAELAFSGDAAEDEATEYFVGVARHYVDTRRHEKTIDWGHLIIALGMIYGPRLVAIRNNAPARLRVVVPIKSGNVPDGMEEIDIPGVGKALRPKDLQ